MIDLENGKITMEYGAGGRAMEELISLVFKPAFANDFLNEGNDQAILPCLDEKGKIAFTTDSYVVTPLFFAGGNIGDLAINGTVNDLAVGGAVPLYISAGFIIEEGFPIQKMKKIVASMGEAAKKTGVKVVTGDTKVVEKGAASGLFINTAGVGFVPEGVALSGNKAEVGDVIILSGSIAEHGVAIMSARKNMEFETSIVSDTAPLNGLVQSMLAASPKGIKCMRDATRGGVAAVLNEIAKQSNVGMMVEESKIPVQKEVVAICDMFGFDPLNIACEGRLVAIVKKEVAGDVLNAMHSNPFGKGANIIGEVIKDSDNLVQMRTLIGGLRLVEWFYGEQLPRIC